METLSWQMKQESMYGRVNINQWLVHRETITKSIIGIGTRRRWQRLKNPFQSCKFDSRKLSRHVSEVSRPVLCLWSLYMYIINIPQTLKRKFQESILEFQTYWRKPGRQSREGLQISGPVPCLVGRSSQNTVQGQEIQLSKVAGVKFHQPYASLCLVD